MTLPEFSIKNTAFPVMLAVAMLVFGYLGYKDLGISQFPEVEYPVVSITTNREAASPDIVDTEVTDVIEDAVSAIEGIDYISSQSLEGQSSVTVYFRLSKDADSATQDVQNAVSAAMNRLPSDIDPPSISKVDRNNFPIIWLAVHGSRPISEIVEFVNNKLKRAIETIPGCGGVFLAGGRDRNMRIWVDGRKLHALDLDVVEVARSLRAGHVEKPAGYLASSATEINVRTLGEARTADDFRRIVIAERKGRLLRLEDVAVIEDGLSERRSFARFNSIPNVGIGVLKAPGANVVAVCDAVKERLPKIREMLPEGIEIGISTDFSLFIKKDVDELKFSLLLGVALTAVVAFLFLGAIGPTINICLSIPTSLIGTFFVMMLCGFTVNFMTLLALSLSVGVVVDDAILVLENIYRRAELGEAPMEAALKGSRQISFAAIAATASIVAIFLPVAFLEGSIGRYFFEFGVTVSVAVVLSLVTSLTLTPMLCSRFLRVHQSPRPRPKPFAGVLGLPITILSQSYWLFDHFLLEPLFIRPVNGLMHLLTWLYGYVVRWSLRHTWFSLSLSSALVALTVVLVTGLDVPAPGILRTALGSDRLIVTPVGRELVPSEDQSRMIVNVICPVGSSVEYVDNALARCEAELRTMPEMATFFSAISSRPGRLVTEGIIYIRLVERNEREKSQEEVLNEIRRRLGALPGLRAVAVDLSTQGFTARRGYPVNFAIQGPNWKKVTEYSEEIVKEMAAAGYFSDLNSDYRPGMPEVRALPNRQKAAEWGVAMNDLGFAINAMVGGVRVGRFTDDGKRYDVRLRLLRADRDSPDDLKNIYVRSRGGGLVPLADLVDVEVAATLPVINRHNHQRKVEITANTAHGVSQGVAVQKAYEIARRILPAEYHIVPLGNSEAMNQTLNSLWFALGLGVIVAYMVLGVQFASFVHPLTVLLALPFAVTGALLTLWWSGDTLNLMSMIGLILLMGLVKKNSIILVDYINQLREEGWALEEAVKEACPVRLRPILMTTLATIAGAIPLAIGIGPGAETRGPLARGVIGGIIVSTLVTLVVVPVFYVLFDRIGQWLIRLIWRTAEDRSDEAGESKPGRHRHSLTPAHV